MILLEVENRGVEDALKDHFANATSKGKFEIVDAKIVDFDGCMYELVSNSARDTLKLSLRIGFFKELAEHGAVEKLKTVYGGLMVDDGSDGVVSLEYKIDRLPENFEKAANEAALLKRNCFAAVFEKYFEAQVSLYLEFLPRLQISIHVLYISQATGSQVKRAVIHYRPDETMYVEAKSDRVTVIFSTLFKDDDDISIGGVFLQEFREGRRGLASAPQVLFSTKAPPQELQGTDARSGDNVGYITFVLLPRHFSSKTPERREKTIDLIHTFRNYLHYHIKCSKAYVNSRMRGKTVEFLKVILPKYHVC
jgi:actin related protein 2/3 complex subunit 2